MLASYCFGNLSGAFGGIDQRPGVRIIARMPGDVRWLKTWTANAGAQPGG